MQLRQKIERLREVRAYVNARTDIGAFKDEWLEALSDVIASELKREGAQDGIQAEVRTPTRQAQGQAPRRLDRGLRSSAEPDSGD